jgi:hypothetical protein
MRGTENNANGATGLSVPVRQGRLWPSLANAYPGKINDLEMCVGLEGSQSGCKNHSAPRHEGSG